jgi:hypothetical protein
MVLQVTVLVEQAKGSSALSAAAIRAGNSAVLKLLTAILRVSYSNRA